MKRFFVLFSVCFLVLCTVPMAALLLMGPTEPAANQTLASMPQLTDRNGAFNDEYLTELSEYVDQRFGFRQELITAEAKLTAAVFRESSTDSVILGKDGWLFYSDTLDDYQGSAPMPDRAIWSAARTLALVQEQAAARGASFLFVMAPNKNTLYPQFMPDRYPRSDRPSNWDRLQAQLDREGVAYVDLVDVLSAQPEPVYYRTDSHWTPYGSALAHDAILSALGVPSALAEEPFVQGAHVGDLQEMLYPADRTAEPSPTLARERTFTALGSFRSPEDLTIRTESDGSLGSLLMFRDSFGNTLYADMAESFSKACFSRAMPIRLDLLDSEAADTLILELVERNLQWLAERPPVMAAPVRETPESLPVDGSVTVAVQDHTQLEGLQQYSGTVPQLDEDSPVYAVLDGVCYEATPAADGSFTLYAPAAETVQILYCLDGQWQCRNGDLGTGLQP